MRKNILGFAAVLIALAASAFTAPVKPAGAKLISYKWFQITANRTPSQSVPQSGATYLGESETPPIGEGCGGTDLQCVSGFEAATQVNSSNQLNGTQMPKVVAATRN
ncbi:hypothetical protein [Mucilaginibacter sp. HD30]